MTAASAPPVAASRGRRGLREAEARARLAAHGPNALPEPERDGAWRRVARQLRSSLVYILLFALAVDLAVWVVEGASGLPFESLAIGAILLLNAGMGVWQEYRAEDALARLRALESPQVWVLRDGHLVRLAAREIVPGDAVRLESGLRIPADGIADGSVGLLVDESLLTGESVPVEKQHGQEVFSGTLVVRGTGFAEITRTGAASAMGQIAQLLGSVRADRTPLEQRLEVFGHRVALGVMALTLLLVVGGFALEGVGQLDETFIFAVALAVAAVPEGLPAVLTLTLALGVERMARRRAVVRKLASVEALGSVTVIASDKTGTLTENRMAVREIDSPDRERALRAMVLASDAEPDTGIGGPLELGLVRCACENGVDPLALRLACPRQSTRSFDSTWKYMRVSVAEDGSTRSYLKGAPEVLLRRAALSDEERAAWSQKIDAYARRGFRTLGLASVEGERESDLAWHGLAVFWDPPRPEAAVAVRAARAAGVRVMMVTGDHPATASAVAQQVGIDASRVVVGSELDGLDPEALADLALRADVFARVSPEHKLALVEALKSRGEIVAMTGDGVNDAPALKRADVGVAMGGRGSDVAREVSDLVLLDDNFATIVAAIEEGRNIYENIQKFLRFLFAANLALVLLVMAGAFGAAALDLRDAGGALLLPLTAAQLLWINIITNGPPALAVGLDHTPGLMTRPPRPAGDSLLDRTALRFVLLTGAANAALGIALLVALPVLGFGALVTRTVVFLYETVGQLAFVYPARRLLSLARRNRVLDAIVVVSLLVHPLILASPSLRLMLGLAPIDARAWGVAAAAVLAIWGFAQLYSRRVAARAPERLASP